MGIGAFGVSGMGVDYRNLDSRLSSMFTNFMLMRSITTLSRVINKHWAFGIGFDFLWGSLNMNAFLQDTHGNTWNAGGGQSQDFGLGLQLAFGYRNKKLTGGIFYQSPTKLKYDNLFDTDGDGKFEQMVLEQPAEYALGLGYKFNKRFAAGADCRYIDWENADGYKDFKWESQWIYSLGMRYKMNNRWTFRCGYNHGDSALKGKNNLNMTNYTNPVPNFTAPFSDFQLQWFNLVGFPAITEDHYTFGFSYEINPNYGFDFGYIYCAKATVTATAAGNAATIQASNKQHAFSMALRWKCTPVLQKLRKVSENLN
jgi:long-chain fatty acid transport protein